MRLIKLTAPNGTVVWFNSEMICSVIENDGTQPDANSIIIHASGRSGVQETVSEVVRQINIPSV